MVNDGLTAFKSKEYLAYHQVIPKCFSDWQKSP